MCIIRGDGAILNLGAAQDSLESGLVGAANLSIKGARVVRGLDVLGGEHLLLFSYRGNHGVRRLGLVAMFSICVKNVQTGRVLLKDHRGTIDEVDAEFCGSGSVHGNATNTAELVHADTFSSLRSTETPLSSRIGNDHFAHHNTKKHCPAFRL